MPARRDGRERGGSSTTPPTSRIATATTTARARARSSTAAASTRWAPRASCIASISRREKSIWKRDLRADYKVPQDFFGTASTPLVEGRLLIVNVGAPGGPCVVGLDKATGREVWRAGTEWGPSYASPVPAVVHGKRRVFVFAGGESDPPTGGLMSIDPANGQRGLRVPVAQPQLRVGQRLLPGGVRQQGVHLGQLSHRRRAPRNAARLHAQRAVDDAGVRAALQHGDLPRTATCTASTAATSRTRRWPAWTRRPERWCGGRRRNGRRRSRPAAPAQQLLGTYRGSLLAVDGQFLCLGELGHLLWMDLTPKGYKEVSRAWLFAGARIVGASRAQPRSALRRAEHARRRARRRAAAAVLRPARLVVARTGRQ